MPDYNITFTNIQGNFANTTATCSYDPYNYIPSYSFKDLAKENEELKKKLAKLQKEYDECLFK